MPRSAPNQQMENPPPEGEQQLFVARDNDDSATSLPLPPKNSTPPPSLARGRSRASLLLLLVALLIVVADRLIARAIGAEPGLSVLAGLPLYWAVRRVGDRLGLLLGATAIALLLAAELVTASMGEPRWFPYWAVAVQLAFFAVVVALAVTQRRLVAERAMATTDSLTGVANRRGFYKALDRELERSRRNRTPMTLVYLDCDDFKRVNDSLGHPAGNRLLVRTASILKDNVRAADLVGRLGGDEFAVLLAEMPTEPSAEVVSRLQARLREAQAVDAQRVTFSIGAITFESPPVDPDEAIRAADALMYQAKRAGKDRVVQEMGGGPPPERHAAK